MRTTIAPYNPEPTEIDIGNLSTEGLQALKQEDPFLYYSIPVVRRAALSFEEPDMSRISSNETTTTTVKRRTRVSFECHSDLLVMDDLLEDFEEAYDQSALEQMDLVLSKLLGPAYAANS